MSIAFSLEDILEELDEDTELQGFEEPDGGRLMANFFYFKGETNKYYAEGIGYVPDTNQKFTRNEIYEVNNGKMPGLSGKGYDFRVVIIPKELNTSGLPTILEPQHG